MQKDGIECSPTRNEQTSKLFTGESRRPCSQLPEFHPIANVFNFETLFIQFQQRSRVIQAVSCYAMLMVEGRTLRKKKTNNSFYSKFSAVLQNKCIHETDTVGMTRLLFRFQVQRELLHQQLFLLQYVELLSVIHSSKTEPNNCINGCWN